MNRVYKLRLTTLHRSVLQAAFCCVQREQAWFLGGWVNSSSEFISICTAYLGNTV